ncbi:hypothetical protein E1B28_007076 [Marasmius oreades]|uniref:RlpA-like protein double-psi beta-barrel domain-containing protein n=1 Tax=Marasmius oreades TaxID=181124 RepID=A0A9P7UTN5_9AGAR|nr:uncharacterized protein E1B28_007076 [Marasmius oreades]KAG7093395.1 hypothetical protein E1B28_007076 [Marasmius oreades]
MMFLSIKSLTLATLLAVPGFAFTGDVTFYTPGLGACGRLNGAGDLIAAVAAPIYNTFPGATANPNLNPICGKKAKVTYQGKSVTVNIVDKCPGCGATGIDLSPAAFVVLAPQSVGRLKGATWTIL